MGVGKKNKLHWERGKCSFCIPTHPSKDQLLVWNVWTLFPEKKCKPDLPPSYTYEGKTSLLVVVYMIDLCYTWSEKSRTVIIFNPVVCRSLYTHPSRIWSLSFARFAWQRKEQYRADQGGMDFSQVGIVLIFPVNWLTQLSFNSSSIYIGSPSS